MIYLSSFFGPGKGPRYSIARWAPDSFTGDKRTLSFLGARDTQGNALRHLDPDTFRARYLDYLASEEVWTRLTAWADTLDPAVDLTLCCWCTTARQQPHTKLYCHRVLLGHVLMKLRPDVPLIFTDGAERPLWEFPESWGVQRPEETSPICTQGDD